jgi:hypothetical protein
MEAVMTDLLLRDLDPSLEREIRKRASESGESLSKAAQTLIRRGLIPQASKTGFGTELRNLVAPIDYVDLDIPRAGKSRPPPDFT